MDYKIVKMYKSKNLFVFVFLLVLIKQAVCWQLQTVYFN